MITTILSHEVKNYNIWRKVFDADADNLEKIGLKVTGMYISIKNPKKVTLICELPSIDSIKNFFSKPDLVDLMKRGGIIGIPEIKILNKV
jgi:hypothetical protein